ncbi:hypothetical protein NLJ89_g12198 [Agrocybe chaxingu]|uniref:Uncharacterized protein n=1 Tax=Agrocybe chaxingu TaxID=84603 RepID=A0A9W8JMB6_9AGAR|nr:hypothetical protein NLJ89_g12198 [Agrocybe chaxingu]
MFELENAGEGGPERALSRGADRVSEVDPAIEGVGEGEGGTMGFWVASGLEGGFGTSGEVIAGLRFELDPDEDSERGEGRRGDDLADVLELAAGPKEEGVDGEVERNAYRSSNPFLFPSLNEEKLLDLGRRPGACGVNPALGMGVEPVGAVSGVVIEFAPGEPSAAN